jgi:hypothetical protein
MSGFRACLLLQHRVGETLDLGRGPNAPGGQSQRYLVGLRTVPKRPFSSLHSLVLSLCVDVVSARPGPEGMEIRTPMALTVIAGLVSSTVLTLVVIPTVYATLDRGR